MKPIPIVYDYEFRGGPSDGRKKIYGLLPGDTVTVHHIPPRKDWGSDEQPLPVGHDYIPRFPVDGEPHLMYIGIRDDDS